MPETASTPSKPQSRTPRFQPYPEYRDSGVPWLGTVPAHWNVQRIKYVAPVVDVRTHRPDTTQPYLALENIEPRTGKLHSPAGAEPPDNITTQFQSGDVLFGKLRPYLAKVFCAPFGGVCSTELLVLRPIHGLDPTALAYQLLNYSFISWIDSLTYGTKMPRVDSFQFGNTPIAIPPPAEQRLIVDFLHRETAKVDALVAKKERLIELFQEKRVGLIERTVRTGLVPESPERNSIIDEMKQTGQIPEAWTITKFRRLINRRARPVSVQPENTYREIGIRSWGKGIFHKSPTTGANLNEKRVFHVEPGDLVLNIVFAWEGAVAVVSECEKGMIASHRFPTFHHADDLCDVDYLLMFLQSEHGRALMALNSPGAAGRNRTIRISAFLDEKIPLPPLEEQREILHTFRDQECLLARVAAKAQTLIDRLQQYRTALISATVTGKIDVRGDAA